jgi:transketolase
MDKMKKMSIEDLTINTIRTLAMDAVQKADSGHPGTPMALAPLAYVLWKHFLKHNPRHPSWLNRDRFILSNGHASMLQYAILYLTGYDVSLEDLKQFRQWSSKTPGHPEYGLTPGIETTTGPLGQGFMNGVGMAIAEAHLAATYNRDEFNIIDHYTYGICSDGDLMEGASHEAASIAGHFGLGKIIYIYDNNHITIEGETKITYSDNVAKRFEGYHWHVQDIGDKANDLQTITRAIEEARKVNDRPSLIIMQSHIGYGSPNKQDTPDAHGSPLGEDEIKKTKEFYGWPPEEKFLVPERVLKHMREAVDRGENLEKDWKKKFDKYEEKYPDMVAQLEAAINGKLPKDWDANIPHFKPEDGPMATRAASGKVINSFAVKVPWLIGGSGDLAPSTKTLIDSSGYFLKGEYQNRNIAWGIREHAMCSASSGIALHRGLRPFASTFFIFTDYARPGIRLASLMELPVIYVMTHDSIGLGEDGPTHQPVEHLASLRAMPHLYIIRPADANETACAWRAAMQRLEGPTMLVLTRQKLPILDRSGYASAEGVFKGAYILSHEKGSSPQAILMATGSEVQLILEAQKKLWEDNVDTRVVSMPCWEFFREQNKDYKDEVLPPSVKARLSVEAGASLGWREWVGDNGEVIGVDRFGTSAPYREIYKHYGLTVDNIISKIKKMIR